VAGQTGAMTARRWQGGCLLGTMATLCISCSGSSTGATSASRTTTCANYGSFIQERADGSFLLDGWRSNNMIQKSYTGSLTLVGAAAVTAVKATGSVDAKFGEHGTAQLSESSVFGSADRNIHGPWQMPDGGFLLQDRNDITRFTASGRRDQTFGTAGTVGLDPMLTRELGSTAIVIAADLRGIVILEASRETKDDNGLSLFRLHLDGTVDSSFGLSGRMRIGGNARSGNLQKPQVIVGADHIYVMEEPAYSTYIGRQVTRYTTDGLLDTMFATSGTWKLAHSTTPQTEDGAMYVVPNGLLVEMFVDDTHNIFRLDSTGTIDTTFGVAGSFRSYRTGR
jgi:hypothetical protein